MIRARAFSHRPVAPPAVILERPDVEGEGAPLVADDKKDIKMEDRKDLKKEEIIS